MTARDTIKTILDAMEIIRQDSINAKVEVLPGLLEDAIAEIDKWKDLADGFAESIVITPGEFKPRINVDIEKFLETQHNHKLASNDIQ